MATQANGTTNAILAFLQHIGACAMRNNTVGVYDARIKRFRTGHPSALGSGDILACIGSRWVEVEIKTGRDRMSPAQKMRRERVSRSRGLYWTVNNFDEFLKLVDENKLRRI